MNISIGVLVSFSLLQSRVLYSLTALVEAQSELYRSLASFERIFEYLDLKLDIVDRPNALTLVRESTGGKIAFKHVWFKYNDETPQWTLSEINFVAEPGQLVALVGPTGSGKSTITHLISRLYDTSIGRVEIDDVDVRDIKLASLQRLVSVVSQESFFLHSTIAHNLRIANPDASDEELIQICKVASIHEHISRLPEGYNTIVGERGYKLSGGEKQRLSIARALLKNPKILILDEATSALDTESERLIQTALNKLMKGRTTFAIAHRLSTIEKADTIFVIENGVILERGKHDQLVAAGKRYSQLCSIQDGASKTESIFQNPLLGGSPQYSPQE